MSASLNSCVVFANCYMVLWTASLSVKLSVAIFPVVRLGRVTAFPVTKCRWVYPVLLTDVLWAQAAALTRESLRAVLFSFRSSFIVKSA